MASQSHGDEDAHAEAPTDVLATMNVDCDLDHVQSLISAQLMKLSSSQIAKAYSDIHGTSPDIEESPQLIARSLRELEADIESISQKEAFDLAKSMDPSYVESSQLRLRFLRGTGFKAKPAAEKLTRFFEIKREFFGNRKLVKDIQQIDLDQRDIAYLYSGHLQLLPLKDNSGRLVIVIYPGPKDRGVSLQSMLRVALYLRMVAIEDEQIQRKGVVFVLSAADIGRGLDLDLPKVKRFTERFVEVHNAMPGAMKALHIICSENSRRPLFNEYIFAILSQFMVLALSPSDVARIRMKIDCSQSEIQDHLKMFGISPDLMPFASKDTTAFAVLLTQRKELEILRRSERGVTINNRHYESVCMPSPFDVISGRGRSLMTHQGNRVLRNLVEEHLGSYEEASRQDKKVVSSKVVDLIKMKGRFLKEHLYGWVEIDDVAARLKVSHAFRDLRASSKKGLDDAVRQEEEIDFSVNFDTDFFDFEGSISDYEGSGSPNN